MFCAGFSIAAPNPFRESKTVYERRLYFTLFYSDGSNPGGDAACVTEHLASAGPMTVFCHRPARAGGPIPLFVVVVVDGGGGGRGGGEAREFFAAHTARGRGRR